MSSLLPAPLKAYEVYGSAAASASGALSFPVPAPRAPSSASLALAPQPSAADASSGGFNAMILAQHRHKSSVHSSFTDLVPHEASQVVQLRPGEAAAAATRDRTAAALDAAVAGAMANVRSGAGVAAAANAASGAASARIIRYTPDEDAPGFNPAARTRIIKMVGAAVDPLEPPKHMHKKMPSGPPDAPVPVMHSPSRKATAEERAAWKIPPCVSNYKNPKGFVIPLDKRIAADGRTLLEAPAISDHRSKLAEALQLAERKAREEVEVRAALQRKLATKEKEEKEAEMRALAQKARLERGGVVDLAAAGMAAGRMGGADFEGLGSSSSSSYAPPMQPYGGGARVAEGANLPAWMKSAEEGSSSSSSSSAAAAAAAGPSARAIPEGGALASLLSDYGPPLSGPPAAAAAAASGAGQQQRLAGESSEEYEERLERDRQRREFRREAERESRGGRAGREARDGERDVSERGALGMGVGAARQGGGGEALFDSRLFNQGGGVHSGFAAEEEDQQPYDSAWRGGGSGASLAGIYRPRAAAGGALSEAAAAAAVEGLQAGAAKRFKAAGDFEGGGGGGGGGALPPPPPARAAGPVEFERGPAGGSNLVAPSGDVFGLDALLGGGGAGGGGASSSQGQPGWHWQGGHNGSSSWGGGQRGCSWGLWGGQEQGDQVHQRLWAVRGAALA